MFISGFYGFNLLRLEKNAIEKEKLLSESEKKFRAIYENSNQGFMLITEKNGFVDCNKRVLEIFGFESAEMLLNKSPLEFSPEYQPNGMFSDEKLKIHFNNLYEFGKEEFEWVHIKKDKTEFYTKILLSKIVISDEIYIFVILEDITTKLKMDEYIKERKILKFLDGIKHSANRAAQIVRNMLDFSRASNREKTIENVNNIIDNTVELALNDYDLKKKFDFKHIKINKIYLQHNLTILCIAPEIEQVILNILKNAAYALYKDKINSPEITIKVYSAKDKVRIGIKNNGPIIPDKVKKRIFEPFFTSKDVGEGTGLGLSVSYFIVNNNHNGKIWFESEEKYGTEFFIELDLYKG